MCVEKESRKPGVLYVCATPIGNLEDMTLRVVRILREVDVIAAESVKRTFKILNHYEINTKIVSYREENRLLQGKYIVGLIKSGRNVALVSDAGMPGLSDPGNHLINMCYQEELKVFCLPGSSSILASLVLSGFSTDRFVFEGFLPRKGSKRKEALEVLSGEKRTVVIFESPVRVKTTLKELSVLIGNRRVCIAREITKLHEEIIWGSALQLIEILDKKEVKGEIVIIIENTQCQSFKKIKQKDDGSCEEQMEKLIRNGMKLKEAARKTAELLGVAINDAYKKGLQIKERTCSDE